MLKLYKGTVLLATADTLLTPERIRWAPAGGVLRGADYFVEVCEFARRRRRRSSLAPLNGTFTIDDSPAPTRPTGRSWKVFPAFAPLAHPAGRSVEQPAHGHASRPGAGQAAAGCDLRRSSNLASRGPWIPTDPVLRSVPDRGPSRLPRTGNNAVSSPRRGLNPGGPGPHGFRPFNSTGCSRLQLSSGRATGTQRDCNSNNFVPGVGYDVSRVGHEPLRAAQPDARLGLLPRLHRATTGTPQATTTSAYTEVLRSKNDPVLGQAQAGAEIASRGRWSR